MSKYLIYFVDDDVIESTFFDSIEDAEEHVKSLYEEDYPYVNYRILRFGDDVEEMYTIFYENDDKSSGLYDSSYDAQIEALKIVNRDYQENFKTYKEYLDSGLTYVRVVRITL